MKSLLLHDLHHGILRRWRSLLALLLLVCAVFGFFALQVHTKNGGNLELTPGVLDYGTELLSAKSAFQASAERPNEFPMVWFVFHLLVCAWSAFYLEGDLRESGPAFMIRTGKRRSFWWSKVLWCAASQVLVYGLVFLLAVVFAFAGGGHFASDPITFGVMFRLAPMENAALFFRLFGISLLVTLACTQLQMTVTLFSSATVGYLVTVVHLLLAALIQASPLPYRFTILEANADAFPCGLLAAVLLYGACAVVGAFRIQKIDIR